MSGFAEEGGWGGTVRRSGRGNCSAASSVTEEENATKKSCLLFKLQNRIFSSFYLQHINSNTIL